MTIAINGDSNAQLNQPTGWTTDCIAHVRFYYILSPLNDCIASVQFISGGHQYGGGGQSLRLSFFPCSTCICAIESELTKHPSTSLVRIIAARGRYSIRAQRLSRRSSELRRMTALDACHPTKHQFRDPTSTVGRSLSQTSTLIKRLMK